MVAVWDVRSRKPMKVFTTDRSRAPPGGAGGMARSGSRATGNASGWLYEDTWDWTMPGHRAPGWGVRNVKFNTGIGGKEIMTFTEVRRQPYFSNEWEIDAQARLLAYIAVTCYRRDHIRARRNHPCPRDCLRSSTVILAKTDLDLDISSLVTFTKSPNTILLTRSPHKR